LTCRKSRCETNSTRAQNMADTQKQIVTVCVTGASGAILAQKTLALLEEDPRVSRIHLVITEAGQRLFAGELGITSGDLKPLPSRVLGHSVAKIDVLTNKDVGASIASGSYAVDSMVIIPCSMGTLGAIAGGISDDLVSRAADVMLKEGASWFSACAIRRSTAWHLENMLRAQQAGAVIMPASAGILSPSENDRRSCYPIRVPRPGANWIGAGTNVSLVGTPTAKKAGGVKAARHSEMTSRIKTVFEMIKFEHSVFALPFALTGRATCRALDTSTDGLRCAKSCGL